ncbi:MAG: ribosome-associated translation inhibitor RaiA [Candidatus Anammoximicrobium sp.]|nr:ribosome-associated translation inhibitor RaiA [Candidatus Anammoximicrobium sp.]
MQLKISARHGHLSPDTQSKISEKVEKLRRLFDRVTSIEVTADLEHRESPTVELRVSVERTEVFVATETAASVLAALDGTIHKLEQQLRKHKDKRRGHRARGAKGVEVAEDAETEED